MNQISNTHILRTHKGKILIHISAKTAKSNAIALSRSFVFENKNDAGKTITTFKFDVISPAQQMKERNKAYRFFTID